MNKAARSKERYIKYSDSAKATCDSFQGTAPVGPSARTNMAPAAAPAIPDYLQETYRWAYLDSRNAKYLDHEVVVNTILWWQHRRLERSAFREIEPGQRVLQSACVYGNFSPILAQRIGPDGCLVVVDVAQVQVRNCRRKLADYKYATVRHENLLYLRGEKFDAVCCYFLLHELPDDCKYDMTRVLLDSVRRGGKVVFVDYHKPHWAHPLRLVSGFIFDVLEPYAKGLWRHEIMEFAGNDERFDWRKETYFGGLYQKVVATRKA
jgi:ubiquinone/menaquinone biosynthesis C-methylase UbiE